MTNETTHDERMTEEAPNVAVTVDTAGTTATDVAAVRELALKAHPDALPELVGGATIAEVMASLEPARAAYRRIVEGTAATGRQGGEAASTTASPPYVPAGAAPAPVVDPDSLPPGEKIRRGLAGRERRSG